MEPMEQQELVKRMQRLEQRVRKLDRLVWKLFEVTTNLMNALKPFIHPDEKE